MKIKWPKNKKQAELEERIEYLTRELVRVNSKLSAVEEDHIKVQENIAEVQERLEQNAKTSLEHGQSLFLVQKAVLNMQEVLEKIIKNN